MMTEKCVTMQLHWIIIQSKVTKPTKVECVEHGWHLVKPRERGQGSR